MFKKTVQRILDILAIPLAYLLRNRMVQEELWKIDHFRPESGLCHWCHRPNDIAAR